MSREFIMPGEIITGTGALEMAKDRLAALGKKALIVTDGVMVQLGNVKKVEDVLFTKNISYTIFSEISGEPTDTMIEEGVRLYREEECEFLIALGGGRPIDSMKAIGALISGSGKITDYMGKVIDTKTPPMVAIPTTAGTGSEATQFTIITDTKNDVKMLLKGSVLLPDVAIIDPQFTMTAPPKITAATGLDALTHAVEAYTSRKAQALSDTFAISAVKRIFKNLPAAFHKGDDTEAREQMAIAALEAGIAFNNASVTIVHGMSRPIGALFHVPHGISNAMLLKECLMFVVDGAYDKFAVLAREIGVSKEGDSNEAASKKFLDAIEKICQELEIPTLTEYGINKEEYLAVVDKMASDALESGSPQNTRKIVDAGDMIEIYKRVISKHQNKE